MIASSAIPLAKAKGAREAGRYACASRPMPASRSCAELLGAIAANRRHRAEVRQCHALARRGLNPRDTNSRKTCRRVLKSLATSSKPVWGALSAFVPATLSPAQQDGDQVSQVLTLGQPRKPNGLCVHSGSVDFFSARAADPKIAQIPPDRRYTDLTASANCARCVNPVARAWIRASCSGQPRGM